MQTGSNYLMAIQWPGRTRMPSPGQLLWRAITSGQIMQQARPARVVLIISTLHMGVQTAGVFVSNGMSLCPRIVSGGQFGLSDTEG